MKIKEGFTLIELMIVVAVIGILAAIAMPKFAGLIRKSQEAATKGNLGSLRSAVMIYYGNSEGSFPAPTASGDMGPGTLGNILCTRVGTFMESMPKSYEPSYHVATASVTVDVSNADESSGAGEWGYQTDAAASGSGVRPYGDIWVNCTHTDIKGSVWGAY